MRRRLDVANRQLAVANAARAPAVPVINQFDAASIRQFNADMTRSFRNNNLTQGMVDQYKRGVIIHAGHLMDMPDVINMIQRRPALDVQLSDGTEFPNTWAC